MCAAHEPPTPTTARWPLVAAWWPEPREPDMDWLTALQHLRTHHQPGVLVTVASARGHTPREAGAKMVVGAEETWDSIGGGNLEATAISHARQMLAAGTTGPQMVQMPLNEHVLTMHGRQCCGGEVSMLLEPVAARAAIGVFGIGYRESTRLNFSHVASAYAVVCLKEIKS